MLDMKILTFLEVVKSGSYTTTAQVLHMTQPAVTQHIQKLEEHYQCKLFTQKGRAMGLTKDGKTLLHFTQIQQSNEEQLKDALKKIKNPLRIGSTLSIADYYLPPFMVRFFEEERTSVEIVVSNTRVLLDGLVKGKLDCAFIEGIFDRKLFEAKLFHTANFIPVVSKNHPYANQKIPLSDLYNFPLVLRERGSGTRAILENYLAQENNTIGSFAQVWEVGSFMLIKEILENSNGVSFMYAAVAKKEIREDKLATVFIEKYQVEHALQFVYLKNGAKEEELLKFYYEEIIKMKQKLLGCI